MTQTASMKRKRKAGRGGHNKREDVPRYPSGRINYDEIARRDDVTKLAKDTRMRLYGIAANDAANDKAGSVFGRMYLQGELGKIRDESGIAETIYEAGMEFARRRKAYLHAIQAPRPTRSGSDIGYVHERLEGEGDAGITGAAPPPLDDEGYADRCASAKARYAEVRRVVMEADSMGLMALETIICEDKPAGGMMGALRVSCNAIARMMRTAKGSRARAY